MCEMYVSLHGAMPTSQDSEALIPHCLSAERAPKAGALPAQTGKLCSCQKSLLTRTCLCMLTIQSNVQPISTRRSTDAHFQLPMV